MMVQMLGSSGQAVNVTIPVYVGGKHLSTVVLDDVNQTERKAVTQLRPQRKEGRYATIY